MQSDDLSLKDLVRTVSEQLLESRAERIARGMPPVFEVDELSLEISFVVTESSGGSGGFDLKVIKADMNEKVDRQSVQRITLKLKSAKRKPGILTDIDESPVAVQPRLVEDR